ncbi:MAG: HAD family phosphatase [Nanoarchaeota archaeon]|nr:HAD family phosphatase [Nanoarchaeota archaeon]MBU1031073.1 HAD family phosphatase [Nanoarchaeota archaeon]MBU1850496.1 HAD family phosphatase [Nanoarchaeota archaeon]
MTISAIVFDFGNVICDFNNDLFLKNIKPYSNKEFSELHNLIYESSNLPRKYETGLISSEEFFMQITKLCNLSIPKNEFINAYTQIFTPKPETFNLIKSLKPNYKLGLLSNTSEYDFEYGIKPIEIFNLFDAVSLSYKIKAMKPNTKIYKDMLEKLHIKAEESIFIDDIKEYVCSASKIGMIGIHYKNHKALIKSLKNFNIVF